MSSALAIAAVSATVRDLLHNHLTNEGVGSVVGNFKVTTLPPDRVLGAGQSDPTQLSWFLHRTSPNSGWINRGQPSRDASGDRVASPPLALNLHFMLSAYGAQELYAEILLGYAMQALHETPVLGRELIRRALSPSSPPPNFPTALAASGLAEQVEMIKLTLVPAPTEDTTRVWTGLNSHLRPSAFYEASVVLIEAKRSARPALPVTDRVIQVVTLNRPQLDAAVDADTPASPVTLASTLRVTGTGLTAPDPRLLLNGLDVTSAATTFTPNAVLHPLSPPPAELRAGIVAVQVLQRFNLGNPPVPHGGVDSNAIAFVLRPEITPGAPNITGSQVVDGVTYRKGTVAVGLAPRVAAQQRVVLLLNEKNPPANRKAFAYSFPAPDNNGVVAPATDAASVVFTFKDVAVGTYLIRVSVDGADSVLKTDLNGRFATPTLTI